MKKEREERTRVGGENRKEEGGESKREESKYHKQRNCGCSPTSRLQVSVFFISILEQVSPTLHLDGSLSGIEI